MRLKVCLSVITTKMKQFVLLGSLFLFIGSSVTSVSGGSVFCYFASWTTYRPGNGKFDVADIDPSLCTHISFTFVGLGDNGTVSILDPWESNEDYGPKGFEHIVALKETNPDLKVVLSMGGWNEGSGKYSKLAADPDLRKVFAQNVLDFIEKWNFEGFDLDWEYPGFRDESNATIDKDDYTALLTELRDVLKPKGYLLSAAVSGAVDRIQVSYDIPALNELLDYINVMAYDFHGAFDHYVGHVSPLYASASDDLNGGNASYNVASGIEYWVDNGADPGKLFLGVVTYGRSFTLEDESRTELYAPIKGPGKAGPYTREDGIMGYNEICELHSDWTYVWDKEQKVPHIINGDQWVGYEDAVSLKQKVDFAISKKLGGMMVWAFDTDDFRGICGDKYPLLNVLQAIRST